MNKETLLDMIKIAKSAVVDVGSTSIKTDNIKEVIRDKSLTETPLCNHKDILLSEHLPKVILLSEDGSYEEINENNLDEYSEKSHDEKAIVIATKGVYRNPEIAIEFYRHYTSEKERERGVLNDPYMHWCVMVNIIFNTALEDFVEYRTYWSESFFNLCRMRSMTVKDTLEAYYKHIEG